MADGLNDVEQFYDMGAIARICAVAHRGDYTVEQFEAMRDDALARSAAAKSPHVAENEADYARQHEIQRREMLRIAGQAPNPRHAWRLRAEANRLLAVASRFEELEVAYG